MTFSTPRSKGLNLNDLQQIAARTFTVPRSHSSRLQGSQAFISRNCYFQVVQFSACPLKFSLRKSRRDSMPIVTYLQR